MFKNPLNQSQERDPRFKTVPFPRERPQPDSNRSVGWFRRLQRQLAERLIRAGRAEDHSQAVEPELFVPDGRWALCIRDGHPDRWFHPGRHQLSPEKAKVEVRLISSDLLRYSELGDGNRLDLALNLPYERALLYVDGVQVGIVKPGIRTANPSQACLGSCRQGLSKPLKEQNTFHPVVSGGEEDPIQDFSFV